MLFLLNIALKIFITSIFENNQNILKRMEEDIFKSYPKALEKISESPEMIKYIVKLTPKGLKTPVQVLLELCTKLHMVIPEFEYHQNPMSSPHQPCFLCQITNYKIFNLKPGHGLKKKMAKEVAALNLLGLIRDNAQSKQFNQELELYM